MDGSNAQPEPSIRWMESAAREFLAGAVASLVPIASCLTYAALIFSGPWQPYLGQGIAMLLVSGAVTACVVAATSSFPAAVAAPISSTSALLAAMLAGLAPTLAGQSPVIALATARAALFAATLATGAVLLALGFLRLGKAVRFVPYPVIAGFMGATGWVMITGAVRMSTNVPLTPSTLPRFVSLHTGSLLLGAVGFAGLLLLLTRRLRHPMVVPLALAAATLATAAGLRAAGVPFAEARAGGLLFAVTGGAATSLPLLSRDTFQPNWAGLAHVAAGIAPVAVVGVLQALVTATGLEVALNTEADLNRELRSQGAANIASALLGGIPGFVSTSFTTVNREVGGRGRVSGMVVGLATLAALAGGGGAMGYIPRFSLSGLLLMLGARLFWNWGIASRHEMPTHEWLLAVAVIGITAAIGFLPALLTGVIGGCVLLAVSMGRLGAIRRRYGVDEGPSSRQRSEREMLVLAARGAEAQVLELGGFVFFGSAYQLYEEVKAAMSARTTRVLVLDLSAVVGIDSSAAPILNRVQALVREAGVRLIVSGVDGAATRLVRAALDPTVLRWATLDEAVEAAEDSVLALHEPEASTADGATDWLAGALGDAGLARELAAHIHLKQFREGEILCRQGEPTNSLIFIESGRVGVLVEAPGRPATRVRVFGRQTIAGELGFFLDFPRTATLRVEREAFAGSLDRTTFQRLSVERPALAVALLNYIIRVQGERLAFATRQVVALRRY